MRIEADGTGNVTVKGHEFQFSGSDLSVTSNSGTITFRDNIGELIGGAATLSIDSTSGNVTVRDNAMIIGTSTGANVDIDSGSGNLTVKNNSFTSPIRDAESDGRCTLKGNSPTFTGLGNCPASG